MKITSSYDVQIIGANDIFLPTIKIFRQAVSFLIEVYTQHWDELSLLKSKSQKGAAEKLIHTTKNNLAQYDFDSQFVGMPSYLRRSAINAALGCVSSYISNHKNWEKTHQGKEPILQIDRNCFPSFYYDNMFEETQSENIARIKIYRNNSWHWFPIKLRNTDVKYLQKRWSHCKKSAPVLEKRGKKFFLRFAFTEKTKLSSKEVEKQTICAVDLGINSDAVCSIMKPDGTVLARKFINFKSEKDHLYHALNKIKKQQREHGSQSTNKIWRYAKNQNNELAKKISNKIMLFATEYNVDVIVFEYLDFKGRKSRNQKLSLWRKNGIQDLVKHSAHRSGIRISRICARNTSALAFDGSGKLLRDKHNHSVATFTNGKKYNCDLSASYNIGARYFIREHLKPFSEKKKSLILAKAPECEKRTLCTLSSLITLDVVLTQFSGVKTKSMAYSG